MGFWFLMLATDLFLQIIMLIFGILYIKRPPKEINPLHGYRTKMSTKNNDTWLFAHNYFGKKCLCSSLVLIPLSIILMLIVLKKSVKAIAAVSLVVIFAEILAFNISFILTEVALKKNFDKNGNRKTN